MSKSTHNDKDKIETNIPVEKNEEIVTVDEVTTVKAYKEDEVEEIEIVEVVEEFEEIPSLKNEIKDISPEFIQKNNDMEEEPTIIEDTEIETVVNSKNDYGNLEGVLKTESKKTENISDKLHDTADFVSKEASAVYDSAKEKLKQGKETLENHEEIEKAFDKSKEVTVNLVQYIKRFVKKPVHTIENADISLLEISVLAIIQTIIVYFSLEMIDPYSFNFVQVTVIMAIAYILFVAVVYVVTYAVNTELDEKYSYKWFASVQMPFVVWLFIGALLFWVSNYDGFVVVTSAVGAMSSACIGMFSAKKLVNVSRDKLAYIVPVMLVAYIGCMFFIMTQLL